MSLARLCSRNGCGRPAVATLTYVYQDQTAVVGPLATFAEPHTYDLCPEHAERLTVPRGWDVVRLAGDYTPAPPSDDDLLALANAVREAGRPRVTTEPVGPPRAVAGDALAGAAGPTRDATGQAGASAGSAGSRPGDSGAGVIRPGRGHLRVVASSD